MPQLSAVAREAPGRLPKAHLNPLAMGIHSLGNVPLCLYRAGGGEGTYFIFHTGGWPRWQGQPGAGRLPPGRPPLGSAGSRAGAAAVAAAIALPAACRRPALCKQRLRKECRFHLT